MNTNIGYALGSVVVVSLISFVGVATLLIRGNVLKRIVRLFVALAVGALLGDALIHLIPEAFRETKNSLWVSLAVIGGMLFFFMLETYLKWHHGHDMEIKTVGPMILVSDGVHNFLDGVIIAASYLVSVPVGVATTLAVIFHEIPQEVGDFAVLLHAGYTRGRAMMWNFVSALLAIAGAVFALIVGDIAQQVVVWALPVAAGMFLYVASSDLVPELHDHRGSRHFVSELAGIIIGVAAMAVLVFLE